MRRNRRLFPLVLAPFAVLCFAIAWPNQAIADGTTLACDEQCEKVCLTKYKAECNAACPKGKYEQLECRTCLAKIDECLGPCGCELENPWTVAERKQQQCLAKNACNDRLMACLGQCTVHAEARACSCVCKERSRTCTNKCGYRESPHPDCLPFIKKK